MKDEVVGKKMMLSINLSHLSALKQTITVRSIRVNWWTLIYIMWVLLPQKLKVEDSSDTLMFYQKQLDLIQGTSIKRLFTAEADRTETYLNRNVK